MSVPDLGSLRDRIEAVDRNIIALIAERLKIVEEVAAAKLTSASPFRDREREDLLLQRLRGLAVAAGLDAHQIERLYRVVMDMSVAHQEATVRNRSDAPLRVAYQGVEGSYSHLAAQRRYAGRPGGALLSGHDTFRAAAESVGSGAADLALLPIENTTAGSINETYDLLAGGTLHITGEIVSSIEHCLLALPGVTLAELRTVLSHPQALAQCHDLFVAHPHLAARADLDTAGAARHVAQANDRTLGAIASSAAAQRYGLAIVARGIQSAVGNATRFVEVALRPAPVPEGTPVKTSLVFALADRPGVLGDILSRLAARNLSLTKLESRPIPEVPFTYRFYADVLGHAASEPFHTALDDIRPLTTDLRVLGSYPSAV
ncbi:MAG TPA: bifunctional chorismate mutase/prephenate dehydratase [Kofleriaceae bacterium]|nr:bifunctional chorismate mutase/prephenate dehydratase [Kofleriaceae bacterium]